MKIETIKVLRGPNQWARFPVLEVRVDLGWLEEHPSHTLPGFNERLMEWLPSMIEHRCSIGERGGFFQRLRTGTWMGHVLEHVLDDRRAYGELVRVTKPSGVLVVQVPFSAPRGITVEYGEPKAEEENHVRSPGVDYIRRLRRLDVEVEWIKDRGEKVLPSNEQFYVVRKRGRSGDA